MTNAGHTARVGKSPSRPTTEKRQTRTAHTLVASLNALRARDQTLVAKLTAEADALRAKVCLSDGAARIEL